MLARWSPFVVTLLAAAPLFAQNDRPRGPRRESSPPVELKNFAFRDEKFQSDAVQREMPFGIYLPKGYDDAANKDVKWPLVIWLHGLFEDHMRFHNRGGAPVLDQVVTDGKLPPCVFVSADGGRTSMYFNRKDQHWEDLITVDLLAHLTKNYRVSDKRDQRAIMGVSMGGMAALRIAFTKPELFGTVAAHSSAVFCEDPDQLPDQLKKSAKQFGLDEVFGNPIQKEPWQKANPLCLANSIDPKVLNTLRIYFDAGTKDSRGFDAGNKLLHEALDKHKVTHTWRLIEGGGHSWGADFEHQTLPYSFAFVGEMFKGAAKDGAKPADAAKGDGKSDGKGESNGGKGDSGGKK